MPRIADLIISMQIDLEKARDFYGEGDREKMLANILHLRDVANRFLLILPKNEPEPPEPTDPD